MLATRTIALAALAAIALPAAAQLRPQYRFPEVARDSSGPAAVQLGTAPVYATPTATLGYGHDSNVTNAQTGRLDSPFATYGADVVLDAQSTRSVYLGELYGTHNSYSDSSQDDFTDWGTRNAYDIAFTTRNFLHLNLDYVQGHEGRGTTDRPDQGSPDIYRLGKAGGLYAYGAPGAQGRVEVYGNYFERRYQNNRDTSQFSDRNTEEYGGVFYWRAMPKTYALVELRGTHNHYLNEGTHLSGTESRYFVGATWEATAATSGTIKVGEYEKSFDSDRPTVRDPAWEVAIDWSPRSYSNFSFYTIRTPVESTGVGDFIRTDTTGVVWNHQWSSVWNTTVGLGYQHSRYQGADRVDDTALADLKATYKFRRWLSFSGEYLYSNRDSNQPNLDYRRNIWLLTAIFSL